MKRRIGKTNTWVKAIGLGGMPLSIASRPERSEAKKVVHASLDEGTNFIDTADVYCIDDHDIGHNEKLISEVLQERSAQDIYVATKGGLARPEGRWETQGRPEHLRKACENSLKALNTEQIFLYQLHAPDDDVPFSESVGELSRLQEEGKIKHIGISNVSRDEIETALQIVQIETVQNRFHPFCKRDLKNGVIPFCKEKEITYLAYSPVGGGHGHHSLSQNEVIESIAKKYDASPYQIILQWHLSIGEQILPIPGASRIQSAVDSARASKIQIDSSELKLITELPDPF